MYIYTHILIHYTYTCIFFYLFYHSTLYASISHETYFSIVFTAMAHPNKGQ